MAPTKTGAPSTAKLCSAVSRSPVWVRVRIRIRVGVGVGVGIRVRVRVSRLDERLVLRDQHLVRVRVRVSSTVSQVNPKGTLALTLTL